LYGLMERMERHIQRMTLKHGAMNEHA